MQCGMMNRVMHDDVMMMQENKIARDFLVVVLAGCHNSTPLTRDLVLEIRLMVPGRRSAI